MPPPYTAEFLVSLERTITTERLTRYLRATGDDLPLALTLYEYNVQLSEVLYGLLHGLEVAVRNAEHHALTASFGTPTWYEHAMLPLTPYWVDKVTEAKRNRTRISPTGKVIPPTAGMVVAELTFGFWVDLLKNGNHRSLWVERKLNAAFPHARRHRSDIHDRLKAIQLLRNRISHQEPVLTSENVLYTGHRTISPAEVLEPVDWVCAHTGQWLKTKFRYNEAIRILESVNGMKISL